MHTHDHSHGHHHHHHPSGTGSKLWWVFGLNLSFTVVEFVGGYFTNSFAITSDAFHDLGDSLALLGAILLERYAHKRRSEHYTYGYRRFSLLSALLICTLLLVSSLFIIYQAAQHLAAPPDVHANGMMWLAVVGILVNGSAVWQLFKKDQNINEKAIRLHLLEDTLGWVAVLIGALVIRFTGLTIIDPLLSLAIALWILYNAFKGIRNTLQIMLQATPVHVDVAQVKQAIAAIEGVDSVTDLHIWSLDGERNISTVHIGMEENTSLVRAIDIKERIKAQMKKLGAGHTTVEVDLKTADCEFEDCD